jgi:Asp-tRNA(Asn)/Glu-tRNA(Gln) amidotransferase A subunit family amidase
MIQQNHLAETVASLQDGSLAIEEYLQELQLRTEDVEPKIKSLLPESDRWSRLRSNAKQIADTNQSHRNQKPLYGIPVGIKDIIHTSGFQTKANSSLPPEELTGPEATVVRQLKAAGALIFGKTVTTEFAYWEPGPTRNPHDTNHTPGGSSSGSAAAVAAGLCPLALGTQTIGSIIRPASFCGIVGFKSSYGRVPAKGVIPLSKSVDHVGFFTQDVPGAEIAASVLCEEWKTIPEKIIDQPTIGIPEGSYLKQANPDAVDRFRSHCDSLKQNGYEVKEVPVLSHIETVNQNHERLIAAEAAMAHHEWYQEYGDKYAAQTTELIEEGYEVPTKEIAVGRHSRSETRDHIANIMDTHDIDLWIAPGACGPAPEGIDSTGDPIMNLPWTHAGLPVLGLPTDDYIKGLPLGVQCISRFNTDEYLLKWGRNIAQTLQS